MPLTTTQLRKEYAPACSRQGALFIPAYTALDAGLKAHSYRPEAHHTGATNCRHITGGKNWSLHAYSPGDSFTFWNGVRLGSTALAVDINWQDNPWGKYLVTDMPKAMVNAIKAIRTNDGQQVWGWGGDYRGNKDAMHFEIVCSKKSLRSGIRWSTVPGVKQIVNVRPWVGIRPGEKNADVYRRGGPDNAVFELQIRLMRHGYDIGRSGVDGHYGPATQAAVRKFKRDFINLQRMTGQIPWPNTDALVGIKTINALRFFG